MDKFEYERTGIFHSKWNKRKSAYYWLGFLEGIMSSGAVEKKEIPAIIAEAESFTRIFPDADAEDLLQDFKAHCHLDLEDAFQQISDMVTEKQYQVASHTEHLEKDTLNRFLGFCAGIICDGVITNREAVVLFNWFAQNPILINHHMFKSLKSSFYGILNKSKFTTSEREEIAEWISQLVGDGYADTGINHIGRSSPIGNVIFDPSAIHLARRTFVLTGPMRMGTRAYITARLESSSAYVENRVTQRTNYVVVSNTASLNWKTTHFGTKIEKAKEYQAVGIKIHFVSESALEKLLS